MQYILWTRPIYLNVFIFSVVVLLDDEYCNWGWIWRRRCDTEGRIHWLTFLLCISEIPVPKFGLEIGYFDLGFCDFAQLGLPQNSKLKWTTATSLYTLPSLSIKTMLPLDAI
jgi:hypothetical protein